MLEWLATAKDEVTSGLDGVGLHFVRSAFAQEGPGNRIFSPLGALLSLGTAVLFDGDEHPCAELLEWLGVRSDMVAGDLAHALRLKEETFKTEIGLKMHLAVYYNDSFTEHEGFDSGIQLVLGRMGVPVVKAHFPSPGAEQINQAVREATDDFICQVLDSASVSDVDVVYVNAIFLDRPWRKWFGRHLMHEWHMPGSSRRITFMGRSGFFPYAVSDSYRYVVVPHVSFTGSCMEIFIKKADNELPTDLTLDEMEKLRRKARVEYWKLFLPKWDFEMDTNIVDLIPESCATALKRQVNSLRVLQTVRMVGDEKGAYFGETTDDETLDPDPFSSEPWYIDHPFIFTIRRGGCTEFIGCAYEMEDMGGGASSDFWDINGLVRVTLG